MSKNKEYIIKRFKKGEISLAKAAKLSRMTLNDFIIYLNSQNISWIDYTEDMYEEDKKALEILNKEVEDE